MCMVSDLNCGWLHVDTWITYIRVDYFYLSDLYKRLSCYAMYVGLGRCFKRCTRICIPNSARLSAVTSPTTPVMPWWFSKWCFGDFERQSLNQNNISNDGPDLARYLGIPNESSHHMSIPLLTMTTWIENFPYSWKHLEVCYILETHSLSRVHLLVHLRNFDLFGYKDNW